MVFVIIALFIVNFRRSTTGLALNAARWSEAGARTSGISVVQMKVIAGSLAALIAGIGGGLLALAQTSFQPSEFATFAGVVWLAVLVTIGVRSNAAALIAGLTFVFPAALAQYYLSTWTWVPTTLPVLFGLGAISAAKYPDGVLAENSRRLTSGAAPRCARRSQAAACWSKTSTSRRRVRRSTPSQRSSERAVVSTATVPEGVSATPNGAPACLEAAGVTVRFGGLTALYNVSIDVKPGRIAGLVGPNGAGKSTLFGVLSGLQRPNTGRVSLEGEDVTASPPPGEPGVGPYLSAARAVSRPDGARAPGRGVPRPDGALAFVA